MTENRSPLAEIEPHLLAIRYLARALDRMIADETGAVCQVIEELQRHVDTAEAAWGRLERRQWAARLNPAE